MENHPATRKAIGGTFQRVLDGALKPQMVQSLELVTTTFARPRVTDMPWADVLGPHRSNQAFTALHTRGSIGRVISGQSQHHDGRFLPRYLVRLSLAWARAIPSFSCRIAHASGSIPVFCLFRMKKVTATVR